MITQPIHSLSSRRTLLKRASMLGAVASAAQSSMVTNKLAGHQDSNKTE